MIVYKYGKKVRVKKYEKRPLTWNSQGKMDKYMGKIVTMVKFNRSVKIKEDGRYWSWNLSNFEEVDIFKLLDDKLFEI